MPAYSPNLTRLAAYLNAVASPDNPYDVATIAHQLGVSKQTIRRLFEKNPDIFHMTMREGLQHYFFVATEKGNRVLRKAGSLDGGIAASNVPAYKLSHREPIPNPAKEPPVAELPKGTMLIAEADYNQLKTTIQELREKINELQTHECFVRERKAALDRAEITRREAAEASKKRYEEYQKASGFPEVQPEEYTNPTMAFEVD